jgi:hypothetical protein
MTLMISWLAAIAVGAVQYFSAIFLAEGADWK